MVALGYPKRMRLGSRRAVDEVFKRGRYHRLGLLHAKTLPAAGPHSRFLVSVKKAIGSAPERNRIKRLVREAIRLNRKRLLAPHDVCLFLTAPPSGPPSKPGARPKKPPPATRTAPLGLAEVEREILKLFQRLGTPGESRTQPVEKSTRNS